MRFTRVAVPAITFVAMSAVAPAFAAGASAGTVTTAAPTSLSAPQAAGSDDDLSGLQGNESPVCSALDGETIPTGDVLARCLRGTHLI